MPTFTFIASIVIAGIFIVNIICSPVFNAKSYSRRIEIDDYNEISFFYFNKFVYCC